jgi:hypothetical protein
VLAACWTAITNSEGYPWRSKCSKNSYFDWPPDYLLKNLFSEDCAPYFQEIEIVSTYSVGAFPPKENLETVNVLRALVTAHRHLAE